MLQLFQQLLSWRAYLRPSLFTETRESELRRLEILRSLMLRTAHYHVVLDGARPVVYDIVGLHSGVGDHRGRHWMTGMVQGRDR